MNHNENIVWASLAEFFFCALESRLQPFLVILLRYDFGWDSIWTDLTTSVQKIIVTCVCPSKYYSIFK